MNVFINRVENRINRIKIAENKDIYKKGKEELYDSRKPSKDRILNILKEEAKSLILVDGEWGIGKTFFMDRVLEEENSILPVKVDVLLFNEKKQMINFVMEEIHKILLEKGIRSTSIRKYLSIINDGIDNKFINGLYRLFSDDKAEDIEKNIKDDIKTLGDEKLVIIVDNLERTLDKKITIDILGFLHYIYERLGVFVVVLADSSKLREEISREIPSAEDYLDKFFIEKIKMEEVKIEQILYEFLKPDEIAKRYEFFNQIPLIVKQLEEEIEHRRKEIEKNNTDESNKKISQMQEDYNFLRSKLSVPRNYQLIKNEVDVINKNIMLMYGIEKNLNNYNRIILGMSIYLKVFKDKFDRKNLSHTYPLRFYLLYNEKTISFGEMKVPPEILYDISSINKSIVELINYSSDEIIKVVDLIEKNGYVKTIEECLKCFEIYFKVFFDYSEEKKQNLINFYKKNYELFKNSLKDFIYEKNNFEGFALVDRMYFLENNESILSILFEKEMSYKNRYKDTGISKEIINISEDLLDKVYKNDKDKFKRRNHKSFDKFYMWCNIEYIEDDNEVIRKSLELADVIEKNTASNTNLSLIEKKYLEYFIKLFRCFFGEEFKTKNRKELEEDLFEYVEKINNNKNLIIKLEERVKETIKINDLLEFERLKKELSELNKELEKKLHDILSPLDFPLKKNEDLEWRIVLWKEFDKKGIEYYEYDNYTIDKRKLSDFYKEFVNKGFEPDEYFEKILKKANIDVFQNEETTETLSY